MRQDTKAFEMMAEINCEFCEAIDGIETTATHVAAQSTDAGQTATWHLICGGHLDGWNDGGDWWAPVFELGARLPDATTVKYGPNPEEHHNDKA